MIIILLVAYPALIAALVRAGHGCILARQNWLMLELPDNGNCIEWGRYDDRRWACCWPNTPYSVCELSSSLTPKPPPKPAVTHRRPDACFINLPVQKCFWAVPNGGLSADAYIEQEPNTCGDFYDHKLFYWWQMCCDRVDAGPSYEPGTTYLTCTAKPSIINPRGPEPTVVTIPPDPHFQSTPTEEWVYVDGIYCFAIHDSPLIPSS